MGHDGDDYPRELISRRQFMRIASIIWATIGLVRSIFGTKTLVAANQVETLLQSGSPSQTPINVDAFVRLSQSLTGVTPLNRDLANAYIKRWYTDANPAYVDWKANRVGSLQDLIRVYEDIESSGGSQVPQLIRTRIMDDPALGPVAEQLLFLWYVSAFFDSNERDPTRAWRYGSPEHYPRGLVWSVARAHPQMMPGGSYGDWSRPPQG